MKRRHFSAIFCTLEVERRSAAWTYDTTKSFLSHEVFKVFKVEWNELKNYT